MFKGRSKGLKRCWGNCLPVDHVVNVTYNGQMTYFLKLRKEGYTISLFMIPFT